MIRQAASDTGMGDGHWLTAARLSVYPRIFLAVFILAGAGWLLMSDGMLDPKGKPVGYDFITFWAASKLTLAGEPAAVFDLARIFEAERSAVDGLQDIFAWHYPPTFQLLIAPLAVVPYLAAFAAWTGATLAAGVAVVRRLAPARQTLLLFLAFPGTYLNLAQGQTGFLTMALFGGALLLLDRRPAAAGILIGLLSYKPHFGLLIPLALACGRQWTAFFAASITTIAFGTASAILLGVDVWVAFWRNMPLLREILEQGGVPWEKMMSLFTALRLLGLGAGPAYALQALLATAAAAGVAWAWWRGVPLRLAAAILGAGALIATPYVFDYDMVLLAVPAALLAWDGIERGWLRGDREILVAAWLSPLLSPVVAHATGLQLGWLCVVAVYAAAVRRAARMPGQRATASGGAAGP